MVLRFSYEHELKNCKLFKEYIITSSKLHTYISRAKLPAFLLVSTPFFCVATYPILMIRKLAPPLFPVTLICQQETTGQDGSMQALCIWPPLGTAQGYIHSTCIAVSRVLTSPLLLLASFRLLPLEECYTLCDKCSVKLTSRSRVELA